MSENKANSSFPAKVGKALVPLVLIIAGGAAWSYFKTTAPVMQRSTPQRKVAVVDVQTASLGNARAVVSAMGTVVAAREVTLKAQVSGVVQSVADAYVPGGRIAKGAELLSLDPADYQVAVKKAQSTLADAKAALAIEQGSQNIAREELRLLSELSAETVAETDLALRKPQLQQAQATVASAEADLRQAMLDLNRTVVRAPFNAMIVERDVNVGTYVGEQESLATLVGTDTFWVEAVVSLEQLALIDLNHPGGCPVTIRSQAGQGQWAGKVVQVAGKLNDSSRMATVIIAVQNPLGTMAKPAASRLMIDDYVYADITGRELNDVIELPRAALQDDDTVWINSDNTLDIRKVTLAWKSTDKVYIKSGLTAGEQVVMSNLATPVQGMALKRVDDAAESAADATAGE
ncbi:RND superfamily efflux pump MFP component [Desulfosarcina ovata subsp. sediminis]|uniref:RND superfamily efflux pump MFP component n=1 Tax=Desulfosarcina ovata subsp. sediminis TaxID=885957 RepID=A0A5K7ZVS8_9BACT|nr:efflux RND transporter periplasmic adaptor subunit [Desulfosarcina ovata]BBO84201.1 RND superfamily efflux pump MFP component [Desulfosarcina ovata subsp. sediminis]